MLNKVIAI